MKLTALILLATYLPLAADSKREQSQAAEIQRQARQIQLLVDELARGVIATAKSSKETASDKRVNAALNLKNQQLSAVNVQQAQAHADESQARDYGTRHLVQALSAEFAKSRIEDEKAFAAWRRQLTISLLASACGLMIVFLTSFLVTMRLRRHR